MSTICTQVKFLNSKGKGNYLEGKELFTRSGEKNTTKWKEVRWALNTIQLHQSVKHSLKYNEKNNVN